jgi:excisionase family DNA binding protein
MTRTNTKKTGRKPSAAPVETVEVLTLAEAAAYLRVREADLLRMLGSKNFPGRRIGDEWRFLKSALRDWLRAPSVPSSKEAVLALAGSWKDDPDWEEMLNEIYKKRGRPMTEEGEGSSSIQTF